MKRFLFGLATAVLALGTTAKTLSTEHSPAVSTVDFVGLFDPFWASLPSFTSGTFGQISVSGPATVTYSFVGSESGYDTSLFAQFFGRFGTATESAGSAIVGVVNEGGALDFSFNDGHAGGTATNAQASSFTAATNPSFVILGSNLSLSGASEYLLGYNDSFRGDADFDDMVVRLSVSPVPEPSTYALMLAGLGVLGFVARRRRSKAGPRAGFFMPGSTASNEQAVDPAHVGSRVIQLPALGQHRLVEQHPGQVIEALAAFEPFHQRVLCVDFENGQAVGGRLSGLLEQASEVSAHVALLGNETSW